MIWGEGQGGAGRADTTAYVAAENGAYVGLSTVVSHYPTAQHGATLVVVAVDPYAGAH